MAKPSYGSSTAVPSLTLNSLATGSTATSAVIDNTSNLAFEYQFQLTYRYGTAPTANNTLLVSVLSSEDNTTFDTISVTLIAIPLTADTSAHTVSFFLTPPLGGPIAAPKYFKIQVTNNGGQSLASTGNSMAYVAIQTQ